VSAVGSFGGGFQPCWQPPATARWGA